MILHNTHITNLNYELNDSKQFIKFSSSSGQAL